MVVAMKGGGKITDAITGAEMPDEERAVTRAILNKEGSIELAPGVAEQLAAMGLTAEDIRKMMLDAVGKHDA